MEELSEVVTSSLSPTPLWDLYADHDDPHTRYSSHPRFLADNWKYSLVPHPSEDGQRGEFFRDPNPDDLLRAHRIVDHYRSYILQER